MWKYVQEIICEGNTWGCSFMPYVFTLQLRGSGIATQWAVVGRAMRVLWDELPNLGSSSLQQQITFIHHPSIITARRAVVGQAMCVLWDELPNLKLSLQFTTHKMSCCVQGCSGTYHAGAVG